MIVYVHAFGCLLHAGLKNVAYIMSCNLKTLELTFAVFAI